MIPFHSQILVVMVSLVLQMSVMDDCINGKLRRTIAKVQHKLLNRVSSYVCHIRRPTVRNALMDFAHQRVVNAVTQFG